MRWLLIGLLISVGALLFLAVAATRHVMRQRRAQAPKPLAGGIGAETPDSIEAGAPKEDGDEAGETK